MDAIGIIRDLFRHMEWADALVFRAARESASDDARVRELLQHLHGTQRAFMTVWRAGEFDRGMLNEQTLDTVEGWCRDFHRDAAQFLDSLTVAALDRETSLPWAGRYAEGAKPTTLGETMIQIASHSTHHRAQVSARLRDLGAKPPFIDYIAWLWMGRPAAAAAKPL